MLTIHEIFHAHQQMPHAVSAGINVMIHGSYVTHLPYFWPCMLEYLQSARDLVGTTVLPGCRVEWQVLSSSVRKCTPCGIDYHAWCFNKLTTSNFDSVLGLARLLRSGGIVQSYGPTICTQSLNLL